MEQKRNRRQHPEFHIQELGRKNNGDLQKTGFMEAWDGKITRPLSPIHATKLPNGHYKVSAYAFTTVNGNTSFTSNDKEVKMDNSTALFTNPTIEDVIVDEGKLTVGLNTTDAELDRNHQHPTAIPQTD